MSKVLSTGLSDADRQRAFMDFIRDIPLADLARVFSTYRLLTEFGLEPDSQKLDACEAELRRRDPSYVLQANQEQSSSGEHGD